MTDARLRGLSRAAPARRSSGGGWVFSFSPNTVFIAPVTIAQKATIDTTDRLPASGLASTITPNSSDTAPVRYRIHSPSATRRTRQPSMTVSTPSTMAWKATTATNAATAAGGTSSA